MLFKVWARAGYQEEHHAAQSVGKTKVFGKGQGENLSSERFPLAGSGAEPLREVRAAHKRKKPTDKTKPSKNAKFNLTDKIGNSRKALIKGTIRQFITIVV